MLAQKITRHFLTQLDRIEFGSLELTTPDGKKYNFEGNIVGPKAQMKLHDWSVISRMAANGDISLAEDYKAGLWETADLTNLLTLGLQNEQVIGDYIFGNPISKLKARIAYFFNKNTIKGSKKNIHAHYDLGNEFYKLWLDPSMTYSSAIFNNPLETLQQAQLNKYDRILDVLNSTNGKILEIGCGWGGFAERAFEKGDFTLRVVTLSEEQHAYSQQRLGEKAEIVLEDYRHQKGLFDHIVSIEMFEAVGEEYWPVYFQKIGSLLKQKGKAVIQTITIHDDLFEKYRQGGDAIRSFIFPGGMLPSPSRFKEEAEKAGLRTSNQYDFGQDYAVTLQQWLKNFDAKEKEVRALGFDDGFIRLWRFYLASCIAGFQTGRANVMQIELTHA